MVELISLYMPLCDSIIQHLNLFCFYSIKTENTHSFFALKYLLIYLYLIPSLLLSFMFSLFFFSSLRMFILGSRIFYDHLAKS